MVAGGCGGGGGHTIINLVVGWLIGWLVRLCGDGLADQRSLSGNVQKKQMVN